MKRNSLITILAIFIIIAAIFTVIKYDLIKDDADEGSIPSDGDTPEPLGNLSFVDAVNTFSFEFFKKINIDNESNTFISPYSIFTALSMTYEGAEGETANEMADVLSIEQDNASFHQYMKNLYGVLNNENENYNISTANALWVRQNFQLLQSYLDVIRDYYGGDATEVDFSNAQQSADIINQWVENNTNGLIKDLILPDYISPLTALILTNAIYFKGIWKVQFDPANTTDRDFEKHSGSTVEIPTMKLV
ncbi:MAG: hypothetical protein JSW62_04245, partial [Thermoplasmatales archaeon]